MAADIFDYDDLADLRYNPFTNEYSPKIIGYGSSSPEERTIPSTSPFIIKLFESPLQTVPLKTKITLKATGEILKEVAKGTTPANKQYAINYDELGNGQVLFNPAQAGQVVYINYYGLGTIHQRSTLKFQIFGSASTKVVASSDSATGSQEIADEIILTTEDAGAKINSIITELSVIGGGEIKILEGTFNLTTDINIEDNIKVNGSGNNTILKKNASSVNIFTTTNKKNFYIGNMFFDGNGKGGNYINDGGTFEENKICENIIVSNTVKNGWAFMECTCINCSAYNTNRGYTGCNYSRGCLIDGYNQNGFEFSDFLINCNATNGSGGAGFAGFINSDHLTNCNSYINSQDGFNNCDYLTNCEALTNGREGFKDCNHISVSKSNNNTLNGFNNCDNIGECQAISNTQDGFESCEGLTNNKSISNTGNGFDNCKVMGFNYSVSNGTQYSVTCFADRAGTQAAQDTSAGGYNG